MIARNLDCFILVQDELEAAIKEVKERYGETEQQYDFTAAEDTMTSSMYNLLKIEHRNLNAENEMRKMFGARAVQGDANRRQGRNRNVRQRPTKLTTRKDTWPHMIKTGIYGEKIVIELRFLTNIYN